MTTLIPKFEQPYSNAVNRPINLKLQETVSVKDFGAVGDGTTDDTTAIQNAITAIGNTKTIFFPAGTYKVSSTLNLQVAGIELCGESNNYSYGVNSINTTISFTNSGVGINTYVSPNSSTSGANVPYITLQNLAFAGNSTATVGIDGGFILQMYNCTVHGFTTCGLRLGVGGQTSKFTNTSFNGNYDGTVALGGGTYYFTNCQWEVNTNCGVTGVFNGGNFTNCIFESNGFFGANLGGSSDQTLFIACHFEQNEASAGASGYQVYMNTDFGVGSLPVRFINCAFSSTGVTNVADVVQGSVVFQGCDNVGTQTYPVIAQGTNSDVVISDSFYGYQVSSLSKLEPGVYADYAASLAFNAGTDYINISSLSQTFGTGNFSVVGVIDFKDASAVVRNIIGGATNAFQISFSGSSTGINNINLYKQDSSAFFSTTVNIPTAPNVPLMFCYSRISGVGYIYIDGKLVTSTTDTNNYSGSNTLVAGGSNGMNGHFYNLSFISGGLSQDDVIRLWKNGGNYAPLNTGTYTMRLNFQVRKAGQIRDDVSATTLAFSGSPVWTTLNSF